MIGRRDLLSIAAASAVAPSFFSAASLSAQTSHQGPDRQRQSRATEVRALRQFAEGTHPRGREAAANDAWQRRWTTLEKDADRLTDGAYLIALRRALGWFRDGHTTILPLEHLGKIPAALSGGPFSRSLPLKASVFQDGLFITAAAQDLRALLGCRVERVGELSTAELIRRHALDWPGNAAWAQQWASAVFSSPALLEGYGAVTDAEGHIPFVFAAAGGRRLARKLPSLPTAPDLIDFKRPPTPRARWAAAAGRGNYVKPLPEHRAIYLSIDDMGDVPGATFIDFTREAFQALDTGEPDRLVIDLRRNGGGDNFLGEALRKRVQRSSFNRPGGLYVLIGPATFSAAQNLANRLERETFATFVGEPTGGAPNHFGDSKLMAGAATGLTAMVSTIPWFDSYPMDKREWIMPDHLVPVTFAAMARGHDPALEFALGHRTGEVANELSEERIFFFNRPTQRQQWKPFWV